MIIGLLLADSGQNAGDTQSAYEVEIRDQSSLVVAYSSGKVTSSSTSFTLAASTLSNNETYEWRVKTYDQSDQASPFSSYAVFSTTTAGTVTITSPSVDNYTGLTSSRVAVGWSFTGTSAQSEYRVRVIRTDTNVTIFDTGFVLGPSVTSYQVTGLLTDIEQRIEVLIEDAVGAVSNTATRLVTPRFSSPLAATVTAAATLDGAGITVTVVNPTPSGADDLPAAQSNNIYRAEANTGDYIKVGECDPNDSFTDYGVASGTLYDYRVGAVASGETLSEPVQDVSTTFLGAYLHNPTDPAGTLRQFLYGGPSKSETVETPASELRFVGRIYPVVEFGEQLAQSVDVKITVPWGETHNADLAYLREAIRARTTVCYRDGRGRKVFGAIRSVSFSDENHGTSAALSVMRVDYLEELA